MKNTARLFCLLFTLLMAAASFGEQHPNFSGTWKLNVNRSETGSSGVTVLTVKVDHKDPALNYTVSGTAGGQDFEETEALTTDGKTSRDSHGINVKAHWEDTTLVAEGTGDDGNMIFLAKLTLSADGRTMTRVVTQRDAPQPRHEIYEKQ